MFARLEGLESGVEKEVLDMLIDVSGFVYKCSYLYFILTLNQIPTPMHYIFSTVTLPLLVDCDD